MSNSNQEGLFEKIIGLARDLGFEHCAYGVRVPLPISQPKILMFNDYSQEWQKKYQDGAYLQVDPAVRHGMTCLTPFIWPAHDTYERAQNFWEDARAHGLAVGWAQPVLAPNGVRGMLTVSRSGEAFSESEIQVLAMKLAWLSQVAHHGMSRQIIQKAATTTDTHLTERELEVLRWTAEGKTSGEIAIIIGITERTVNFHINSAMGKLNASNRTAAVVRAVLLGIIT